jgi:hypothetical protein
LRGCEGRAGVLSELKKKIGSRKGAKARRGWPSDAKRLNIATVTLAGRYRMKGRWRGKSLTLRAFAPSREPKTFFFPHRPTQANPRRK